MSELKISSEFCFIPKELSIKKSQEALNLYSEGIENASNLCDDTPIFLDTNVLLDYYKISFSERIELQKFFEINKERIYLTKQIETEFLKHRIDHIKSYSKSLEEFVNAYKNIKSEIEKLKTGEIKGFDQFLNNNILKNDFQELRDELKTTNETIKEKLQVLFRDTDFEQQILEKEAKIEEIKKRLEGQADIERKDPLLDLLANFKVTPILTEEEKTFLTELYSNLVKSYNEVKEDQNHNWKKTFPGCGEKKEEPCGDFIIYHEILKFMKESDKTVIFLTNDTEKNDWLLRRRTELLPYTHYVVNTYIATGKTMYIFRAKDKMRISYQPVYIEEVGQPQVSITVNQQSEPQPLPGPKIIGKIELPDFDDLDDFDFNPDNFRDYRQISENEFIDELYQSQKWAKNYGDNFVGVRSFIVKYLGSKGFEFKHSFSVKDKLIENGIIKEYIHKAVKEFYNDVEAIELTEEGIELAKKISST